MDHELIKNELFDDETQENPIIIFSSFQYPDRSFPSIDDDFNFDFSRFDNDSIDQSNIYSTLHGQNSPNSEDGQLNLHEDDIRFGFNMAVEMNQSKYVLSDSNDDDDELNITNNYDIPLIL